MRMQWLPQSDLGKVESKRPPFAKGRGAKDGAPAGPPPFQRRQAEGGPYKCEKQVPRVARDSAASDHKDTTTAKSSG